MIRKTTGENTTGRVYNKPVSKRVKQEGTSAPKDKFSRTKADADWNKIPGFAQKYFTHDNKVKPLFDRSVTPGNDDDDIFKNIEQLLKSAKNSVQIEMFSLDKKDIVDLLIKDAKRGVKVQVVMDPPNEDWEKDKEDAIVKLRKNGVNVQLYPVKEAGSPEAKYGNIDHVKMLIVDGSKAVIGGMNWGAHSEHNHDVDIMVEGPAVDKMEWLFRESFIKSGGDKSELPFIEKSPPHPEGNTSLNLLVGGADVKYKVIEKSVHRAIDNAKKSIHCELFVLSRRPTIEKLIAAHERGVDVKVLLNPLKIKDNPINEKAAQRLKEAGVPVKWFVPDEESKSKLHAKMAVFDDDQVILGSANWSYAGLNVNREANVEIMDKEVNSSFDDMFTNDWEKGSLEPQYLVEADESPGG